MPEICWFYGIVIRMYLADHEPPHFHASYGSQQALVGIERLAVIYGRLPARAEGLVIEWATLRQGALLEAWGQAQRLETVNRIAPLE